MRVTKGPGHGRRLIGFTIALADSAAWGHNLGAEKKGPSSEDDENVPPRKSRNEEYRTPTFSSDCTFDIRRSAAGRRKFRFCRRAKLSCKLQRERPAAYSFA